MGVGGLVAATLIVMSVWLGPWVFATGGGGAPDAVAELAMRR